MKVLQYNHLDTAGLSSQFKKIVEQLKADDFYSAEVKKLKNTHFYRAKLDYANRLLFKIVRYNNENYALLLEIIRNHEYEKSRFLNRDAIIDESQIVDVSYLENNALENVNYINEKLNYFNVLDKIISFDDIQYGIFTLHPPLILIGSAGSGKTMLTLEKMKACVDDVLYVTHSSFLVENSRQLYYAYDYENEHQQVDFLSYRELLETIKFPEGREVNANIFSKWAARFKQDRRFKDANKLYEEFRGVMTGSLISHAYRSREDYMGLGIKQSIFLPEERGDVYAIFEKYISFLKAENYYDTNIISHQYLNLTQPRYDFIVIDEVQDFTNIQIHFILKLLRHPGNFILSGDSNQIVHPNFFSWSKVKTMFYEESPEKSANIMRILHKNYRNSPEVVFLANQILKLKNQRFGSIDKESNYLVSSVSTNKGSVQCLTAAKENIQELNQKTKKSTKFAVLVLSDDQKPLARQNFQTPLVFSIQEAKGLEYENIILFNFITSESDKYREITKGVSIEALTANDLNFSRGKDKTDRSMEIYKFYINALYVAITRSIKSLYILEDLRKHPLFELFNIEIEDHNVMLNAEESSLDEWRREARKLELQGKQEQADDIRNNILAQKKTPWVVIDKSQLSALIERAFNPSRPDKEAKLLLLEYAVIYHINTLINKLQGDGFKPAFNPKKSEDIIEGKYYLFYGSQNIMAVTRQIDLYGIDFRNVFNFTPLMIAAIKGNNFLIEHLIKNGANTELLNNVGQNAFRLALSEAYHDKKYAQAKLSKIYPLLSPVSIGVKYDNKLIKVDAHLMEYFLFNLMFSITIHHFSQPVFEYRSGFCTGDFIDALEHFPTSVLLDRRKKRSYISSILSKNEVSRDDKYNRKLFLRMRTGYYILHPDLEIKVGEEWVNVYRLLNIEPIKNQESRFHTTHDKTQ